MEKELIEEMKQLIAELHNQMLNLSAGLWELNAKVDGMLMEDKGISSSRKEYDQYIENLEPYPIGDDSLIDIEHSEPEPSLPFGNQIATPEEQPVRSRGRPRKGFVQPDRPEETTPDAQGLPPMPEPPRMARNPVPQPENQPNAQETPKKEVRVGAVERLLGKDASEKQKQREDRMAQLEKELAELSRKK